VRFEPTRAAETPFFMEELIARTNAAFEAGAAHPLIIISAFVLDFSASTRSLTAMGARRGSRCPSSFESPSSSWWPETRQRRS